MKYLDEKLEDFTAELRSVNATVIPKLEQRASLNFLLQRNFHLLFSP